MRGCESRAGLRHLLGRLAVRVARGRWSAGPRTTGVERRLAH